MVTNNTDDSVEFDETESEEVPEDTSTSGYVRIIEAVVHPKDIIQRMEMSDIPKGKQGRRYALLLAQELIKKEMRDRRKIANHKRVSFGTLALIALATVGRGQERQFIDEMIQLKTIETDKDRETINQMGGS